MQNPNMIPFMGNYERIIGQYCFVKVRNDYIAGRVHAYYYKSRTYSVHCGDGKVRKVKTVYQQVFGNR